ncbi:hypothetical protein F2Q68_00015405 [Brassica cretica]|uniref:Uncharacterized protein n=2 Tax=Brassica cretica TaxID=69181 RepID=A0ABQ7F3F4_BRACR|nr:hypothetical protein F2Q68_00015405 [Brassica cretica]KAF3610052.1 hypothetical protein DY000_02048043 [Brassica cretica]
MPVLLKNSQSALREKAAEKRKPRRSMQHSARRSMEIPDRGPCIFYDCVKPRSHKLPKCPWTTRNPIYVISKPLLTATLSIRFHFHCFSERREGRNSYQSPPGTPLVFLSILFQFYIYSSMIFVFISE